MGRLEKALTGARPAVKSNRAFDHPHKYMFELVDVAREFGGYSASQLYV